MTLQELYTRIDGNYDHAVQIMRMEKLIDRYVRKFPAGSLNDALMAAGASAVTVVTATQAGSK